MAPLHTVINRYETGAYGCPTTTWKTMSSFTQGFSGNSTKISNFVDFLTFRNINLQNLRRASAFIDIMDRKVDQVKIEEQNNCNDWISFYRKPRISWPSIGTCLPRIRWSRTKGSTKGYHHPQFASDCKMCEWCHHRGFRPREKHICWVLQWIFLPFSVWLRWYHHQVRDWLDWPRGSCLRDTRWVFTGESKNQDHHYKNKKIIHSIILWTYFCNDLI